MGGGGRWWWWGGGGGGTDRNRGCYNTLIYFKSLTLRKNIYDKENDFDKSKTVYRAFIYLYKLEKHTQYQIYKKGIMYSRKSKNKKICSFEDRTANDVSHCYKPCSGEIIDILYQHAGMPTKHHESKCVQIFLMLRLNSSIYLS